MNHRDGRAVQGDVLRSEGSHSYSDQSTKKCNVSRGEYREVEGDLADLAVVVIVRGNQVMIFLCPSLKYWKPWTVGTGSGILHSLYLDNFITFLLCNFFHFLPDRLLSFYNTTVQVKKFP